jgi:hypothetical protein
VTDVEILYQSIGDLTRYKELLWLDRHSYLPLAALALLTWLVAGWSGLAIGFCCSTVAVWHVTFSVNSLSHLVGRQRYITGDRSRNNWVLALLGRGLAQQSLMPIKPRSGKGFAGGNLTRHSIYCTPYRGSDLSGTCMSRRRRL